MKKLNSLSTWAVLASVIAVTSPAHAAVIAVIDSGTDVMHPDLSNKLWSNPDDIDDAVDNDDNGYVDDVHGWNFMDNNNRLIDRKQIGTYPPDIFKFFEMQTKMLRGTATPAEITWMRAQIANETFLHKLEAFGLFAHGTHVAGISSRDADDARIMTLKMLGNATSQLFIPYTEARLAQQGANKGGDIREQIVYAGLDYIAKAQGTAVAPEGAYIASKKARVANCSFGSSRSAIAPRFKPLIETVLGKKLTDKELNVYLDYFVNKASDSMRTALIDPARDTLFVIAAGNDAADNDVVPTAPANVRTDNAITVAATVDHDRLASFSNYGAVHVDIAAPGVGIRSTAPGGGYLELSGTSQAAPFVANLAGRIIDANPSLTPLEVKQVLMGTVDHKDFLIGKVVSSGVANIERAILAAKLSTAGSLSSAIERSRVQVADVVASGVAKRVFEKALFVQPMPALIR